MWRFPGFIPFEMLNYSPMYIFTSVLGIEELQTEPGIVSVPPVWEASQGQRTVNYLQTRTTGQLWRAGPAQSSAPQLFCSPKLVDQSAEGERKKYKK